MRRLRVGMAQINTTVGDFNGNFQKMLKAISDARALGVDLLTFPELAICGYPPPLSMMAGLPASITRFTCPTTGSLTRTATSGRAKSVRYMLLSASASASISVRTSGMRRGRLPPRPTPGPRS